MKAGDYYLTHVPHPFACAAYMLGGLNTYKDQEGSLILLHAIAGGYKLGYKSNEEQVKETQHNWRSYTSPADQSLTGLIYFMQASDAGEAGPGDKLKAEIEKESLGQVLESPEVVNSGHGGIYRNKGFMWIMDKLAVQEYRKRHAKAIKEHQVANTKAYQDYSPSSYL